MADTKSLAFKVLAQVTGAKQFDDLAKKVGTVESKALSLGGAVQALGIAFLAKQAVTYGESIFEAGDQLNKLSQKTGVAVSTLAEFQVAGELADVPIQALAKNLNKLGVNIVNASAGNQDFAGTFKNLGISIRDSDGKLKNAGDVVLELSDKFKGMKDGAEKAAVATKLFGKSGFELIPFLDQGSEGIRKFSLAIDDDFAKRSEIFNDSIKLIGVNAKNSALNGLKTLLPTLQELADAFIDFTKSGNDSVGIFEAVGEAARVLSIGVVTSGTAIATLVDRAVTGIRETKALLTGDLNEIRRLDNESTARIEKRNAAAEKFILSTTKNSKLFGQGTAAEIAARQREATKPTQTTKSGKIDDDIIGENQKILRTFDERIAKIRAEAAAVGQSNVQKQAGVILAELESKGISKSSKSYAIYAERIRSAVTALEAAKEKQSARDLERKEQESYELQKLQLDNYSKSAVELQKLTTNKELDNQATEATINFTKEGKAAYLQATEAVKAQRAALIDLQAEQRSSFGVGAKQALKEYLDAARDVAAQSKAAFTQAFSNIEDSLVDLVKNGKTNFDKLASDFTDALIRMAIKAAAFQAVTGFSSIFSSSAANAVTAPGNDFGSALGTYQFAKGGIMSGKGAPELKRYAAGGIASRPQLALFGEGAGPEAYVPLPDGRSIPVSMKGQGSSNNVSITVNMDGGGDTTRASSDDGRQLGLAIKNAVTQELINQKRPGGILSA